jgi:hypothetical protein
MDITELQRTLHITETASAPEDRPRFAPERAGLWKLQEINPDGSLIVRAVYDPDQVGSAELTVLPVPGDTPTVGAQGILVVRGDGERCFFSRRRGGFRAAADPRHLAPVGSPVTGHFGHWLERSAAGWQTTRLDIPLWRFDTPLAQDPRWQYVLVTGRDSGPHFSFEFEQDVQPGEIEVFWLSPRLRTRVVLLLEDFDPDTVDYAAYLALSRAEFAAYDTVMAIHTTESTSSTLAQSNPWSRAMTYPDSPIFGLAIELDLQDLPAAAPEGSRADARLAFETFQYGPLSLE